MRENNQQYKKEKAQRKTGLKTVNTKRRLYFYWTAVVLYMAMIYYFSSQDGTKSHEVSSQLLEYLKFLILFIPGSIIDFISGVSKNYEFILRKCAHFTEYLVLSLIVYKAMRASEVRMKKSVILTLIICFLYAVSNEAVKITPEKIKEVDKKVSTADKLKAISILLKKLDSSDISILTNMVKDGITEEEINLAKQIIKKKVTEEEKETLKSLYYENEHLLHE